MSDFVVDGEPWQPPESSREQGYALTPPSSQESSAALTGETSTLGPFSRALEAGQYEDGWWGHLARGISAAAAADQGATLADVGLTPDLKPIPAPKLTADDANKKYAPLGPDGKPVPITDQDVPEPVAKMLGKAKANELDREAVLAAYQQNTSWPLRFASGTVAFMMDPLNAASVFLPGVGEETALAGAARLGMTGVVGRTAARLAAGAATGAIAQAPLSVARYGLAPYAGQDYSLRDAFRDMMYGAAGGAILQAGFGSLGDVLGNRRSIPVTERPDVTATLNAAPAVRADAMKASVAQILDGRQVDVEPVLGAEPGGFEAYHGSPHDFERFDLSKIGTDEGAQAYGRGLYFAENPDVAREYLPQDKQQFTVSTEFRPEGDQYTVYGPGNEMRGRFGSRDEARALADELNKTSKTLYKVRIAANPEDFLDWDKPLSEQSPQVQQALSGLGIKDNQLPYQALENKPSLRRTITPDEMAGIYPPGTNPMPVSPETTLREAGIPGIKYLDQGSRSIGEGTRNYVLFDDKLIRITHKNGQEIADAQRELFRNGFAPGIPQSDFDAAKEAIYGEPKSAAETENAGAQEAVQKAQPAPKAEGAVPAEGEAPARVAGEEGAETALALPLPATPELDKQLAEAQTTIPAELHPEDQAEIVAADQAMNEAQSAHDAYAQAAQCLKDAYGG